MKHMRFHMHLLPTYFPDLDPPFEVFYQQILDQICLAEELGWECFWFTEHHFNLYGGPEPNPAVFRCTLRHTGYLRFRCNFLRRLMLLK
jgi:alkanesulfonate monooxygenase SsuD/methylene tetrahydromethanopterin reductase-like flavin-dependent oxidoreductase (luciferase family)